MIRDTVLQLLHIHSKELKQYHVKSMYLFGSVARGEDGPESDIDILVAFEGATSFDAYMDLKFYLESLFQRKVDLITESGLRPELRKYVAEDQIRAA